MTEATSPEDRLEAAGLVLPALPEPRGAYRTHVRGGDILYLSAHGPYASDGGFTHRGRIGDDLTPAEGREAAAACALALLATARFALSDLGLVREILTVRGYLNAMDDFEDHAPVLDGASDVLVTAFGGHGRAARTAVGVASLPFRLPIVVEAALLVEDGP